MTALHVLSVAYPFAPVSADTAGGAEQILAALDRALVAAGHRSTVIARADSRPAGQLVPIPVEPVVDEAARRRVHAALRAAIAMAGRDADIIHCHGIDMADYLPAEGAPLLGTLHLPPGWYPSGLFTPARGGIWLHAVSASQHARCPPSPVLLPPIANGVDVKALASGRHARRGFALMLGRICPEKGQHLALEAARLASVPLLLAGEAFGHAAHQDYLDEQIRPRLDRCRRWIGPVGLARKRRLLAAARCVLIPSLCEETSSLVAMEAAACGTPVVAFDRGALPETVRDGHTGFVVRDEIAMAQAIGRTQQIDGAACRAHAREHFNAVRMTDGYLRRYRELAA